MAMTACQQCSDQLNLLSLNGRPLTLERCADWHAFLRISGTTSMVRGAASSGIRPSIHIRHLPIISNMSGAASTMRDQRSDPAPGRKGVLFHVQLCTLA